MQMLTHIRKARKWFRLVWVPAPFTQGPGLTLTCSVAGIPAICQPSRNRPMKTKQIQSES